MLCFNNSKERFFFMHCFNFNFWIKLNKGELILTIKFLITITQLSLNIYKSYVEKLIGKQTCILRQKKLYIIHRSIFK